MLDEYIEIEGKYLLHFKNYRLTPQTKGLKYECHNELELSFVKSGRGIYNIEGKLYDIEPDDIFVFNNIEAHGIIHIEPSIVLENTVIMFDPRFIWSFESNLFDQRYLDIFFNRNELFENRIERSNKASAELRRLFREIEDEFINKLPEYQLMIKVKLLSILVVLTRYFGYIKNDGNDDSAKRKRDLLIVNKVIDYIDSNLASEISLKDLAGIAHMNSSYFSTFFKKYIGISPMEYIIKKRLSRAVEYLRGTDKTILEIACLCGFNNSVSFNKTFKKFIGKVPSDFRQHENKLTC
ncbi:MAG: AraC family transcriptional regulator [Clostridia bacterium]|nr:AraC family transcriptional regulator [Clostridia bacterium]